MPECSANARIIKFPPARNNSGQLLSSARENTYTSLSSHFPTHNKIPRLFLVTPWRGFFNHLFFYENKQQKNSFNRSGAFIELFPVRRRQINHFLVVSCSLSGNSSLSSFFPGWFFWKIPFDVRRFSGRRPCFSTFISCSSFFFSLRTFFISLFVCRLIRFSSPFAKQTLVEWPFFNSGKRFLSHSDLTLWKAAKFIQPSHKN